MDASVHSTRHGSLMETAEEILRRRADSLSTESEAESIHDMLAILLFRMGVEWYAVKVADVREIYQEYTLTSIPCVPDFVLGVVNIRGEILSVTDLSKMMRLGAVSSTEVQPPAIVIKNSECVTAIVIDEIGDIAEIPLEQVEPPISVIDKAQGEFIAGSIHIEEKMIGLIAVDRILQPIGAGGRH